MFYLIIEFLLDECMMINLDGEYGGDVFIILVNFKNYIRFFVNIDEILDDVLVLDKDELVIEVIVQKFVNEVDDLEGLGD